MTISMIRSNLESCQTNNKHEIVQVISKTAKRAIQGGAIAGPGGAIAGAFVGMIEAVMGNDKKEADAGDTMKNTMSLAKTVFKPI